MDFSIKDTGDNRATTSANVTQNLEGNGKHGLVLL